MAYRIGRRGYNSFERKAYGRAMRAKAREAAMASRADQTIPSREVYGAKESNGLVDGHTYHSVDREERVDWADSRLEKITRLRLISDPGFPYWDVSYCHGRTKDGKECRVVLPFSQLKKGQVNAEIIAHAKREGVYAKKLGIFDAISTLN